MEIKKNNGISNRYCDRCGAPLTKNNNKCGFEICDLCNDILEHSPYESQESEEQGLPENSME